MQMDFIKKDFIRVAFVVKSAIIKCTWRGINCFIGANVFFLLSYNRHRKKAIYSILNTTVTLSLFAYILQYTRFVLETVFFFCHRK